MLFIAQWFEWYFSVRYIYAQKGTVTIFKTRKFLNCCKYLQKKICVLVMFPS